MAAFSCQQKAHCFQSKIFSLGHMFAQKRIIGCAQCLFLQPVHSLKQHTGGGVIHKQQASESDAPSIEELAANPFTSWAHFPHPWKEDSGAHSPGMPQDLTRQREVQQLAILNSLNYSLAVFFFTWKFIQNKKSSNYKIWKLKFTSNITRSSRKIIWYLY